MACLVHERLFALALGLRLTTLDLGAFLGRSPGTFRRRLRRLLLFLATAPATIGLLAFLLKRAVLGALGTGAT